MVDPDLRGKGRQPWEGYDEYCSRVDDELREAGEYREPFWPYLLVYLFILACVGYPLWRYFQ
jgi:cytochrome bd-type quinol oxidase subunit 1